LFLILLLNFTFWRYFSLLSCWYVFQIDKLTNHEVYNKKKQYICNTHFVALNFTFWRYFRLLSCWYVFLIDKLTNHEVYNKKKQWNNWIVHKFAKNLKFLKKFSGHILAVRRVSYSIKDAQDIGLWLILQFHRVWCNMWLLTFFVWNIVTSF
jgi:hypothetical protein